MTKLWATFCVSIFILALLYMCFYPYIYAVENNATECIFAEDTMTCVMIKKHR